MTSQAQRWHHSLGLSCYCALRPNGLLAALGIVVLCQAVASAQFAYQRIVSLGDATDSGSTPLSSLISGPDGTLYGTTYYGGVSNAGTIFKLNKDGSGYQPLYHFKGSPGDAQYPYGPLAMGTNGVLFGTTEFGGSNSVGALFMMKSDGNGYRVLVHFGGSPGAYPRGQLILGDDGSLYGTTRSGGTSGGGTIYKIRHDGSGFQVVYNLAAPAMTGWDQRSWLLRASDGRFYGTCFSGGTDGHGTVFRINQDGSDFTTIYNFKGTNFADGAGPHAPLIEGKDGFLYGTTQNGGLPSPFLGTDERGWGTVFKIRKDGSDYRVLHLMDADHGEPAVNYGGVVEGDDGAMYGTSLGSSSAGFPGAVYRLEADGSNFSVVQWFGVSPSDPAGPRSSLLKAGAGTFYGTTESGGTPANHGAVFTIHEDGSGFNTLHAFLALKSFERLPRSGVLKGSDGAWYGTTEAGGTSNAGTIFVLNTNGSGFRVLLAFGSTASDGKIPNGLIESSDGFFYGTTQSGGTNGFGTIFKVQKDANNYRLLHHFGSTGDGRSPFGALLEGSDGSFYGCTYVGGTLNRGTIFKIDRDGDGYQVLRSFGSSPDGGGSQCALIESQGILYGTTSSGGAGGRGRIFRINKDGSGYGAVRDFAASPDGQGPRTGLFAGSDGMIYGTTPLGGSNALGTLFRVAPDGGGYLVLHSFTGANGDGATPKGTVLEGADGFMYGLTSQGGITNQGAPAGRGVVFGISKDGAVYRTLWQFDTVVLDGETGVGGLSVAGDGTFWGCTEAGGELGFGTVFRVDPMLVLLGIQPQGATALVHWPISSTFDQLEEATDLKAERTQWSPSASAASTNGSDYQVTIPSTPGSRFLRVTRGWK